MGRLFQYIVATIIIAVGVILVLDNLGIATFNVKNGWLYIYPVLFMVAGLKWMIDRIRFKGGSWIFGSFFFIFGGLLILDRFDVIAFVFKDVFKLWPLLIIYFGFSFIRHSNGNGKVFVDTGKRGNYKKGYNKKAFSFVGDIEYNRPNWKVEPLNLSNMAGDFYFDFSKAFIPEKETPITISALAGDVRILMPENVAFCVNASVVAGDINIFGQKMDGINRTIAYQSDHYDEAVQKINFTLKLKAGSVRIDHV
ncbi:cell wall-active antibiotics response protein LiaF [Virgibacillus halotolerans]|uniref:cell wall-active antibiotics response protein LiaF n=1 Tax=Virgibacillus halotolerans TaxID=1071053 RepID=UPI00195FC7CF|nr:cell wall-active antibiotics response protein LiaF [Virgibacillus halotolerans]